MSESIETTASQPSAKQVKPGGGTTEFKLTALVHLLALILGFYGAYKGNEALVAIAAALAGGSGAVYTAVRGKLKQLNGA